MEHTNKSTFIFHYREIPQWLEQSPIAFALLALFARRARREAGDVGWNGENIHLEPKQFIAGRKTLSQKLGITEGQYRGAYKKLLRYGSIRTIRTTKRYTIGLYCSDEIFSINASTNLPSEQPTDLPTHSQPITTNKNENNEKNFNSRLDKSTEESHKSLSNKESKGYEKFREIAERVRHG